MLVQVFEQLLLDLGGLPLEEVVNSHDLSLVLERRLFLD